MKVTVEIEGKPSEVAALVGEIAGRLTTLEVDARQMAEALTNGASRDTCEACS